MSTLSPTLDADRVPVGTPPGAPTGTARRWSPVIGNPTALVLIAPLMLLLAAFVFYPLIKLTADALTMGDGLGNFSAAWESNAARKALVTTLVASIAITLVSVAMGSLLAWYLRTARRSWLRGLLWLGVLAPFWMGTIVKTYAIILLIGNNGALNDLLGVVGLGPVSLLYTPTAVVLGMVYTMVPYATVSVYAVFAGIDEGLLKAAQSMGASRVRALRTVMLPLALPGVVASTALIFALCVGFYVTPILLGGAQTSFMASVIQDNVLQYFNYPLAAALSVVLLVVAVVTLLVALTLVGRKRLQRAIA